MRLRASSEGGAGSFLHGEPPVDEPVPIGHLIRLLEIPKMLPHVRDGAFCNAGSYRQYLFYMLY